MYSKAIVTGTIVIVEDDQDDQFLMRKVFERIGVRSDLIFLANGKEALEYLEATEKEIFLIICDINMPVMNGLELRSKIFLDSHLRKKSIPFVFLSTAARPVDIITAYDMTVQGFFTKATTLEGMEEVLRGIVMYWSKCKHPNSITREI